MMAGAWPGSLVVRRDAAHVMTRAAEKGIGVWGSGRDRGKLWVARGGAESRAGVRPAD